MERVLPERRPISVVGFSAVAILAIWVAATSPDDASLRDVIAQMAPGLLAAGLVVMIGSVRDRTKHLAPTARSSVPSATDHAAWRVSRSGGAPSEILAATIGGRQRALAERQCDALERIQIAVAQGRDPGSDLDALQRLIYRGHRSGQTLLVLAADEPGGSRRGPTLLDDIMCDAMADHDDAERIDITSIDWCVVRDDAADDLAHLIAEVLDNALESSPSSTAIEVVGRWSNSDYVLSILDEGIGLDAASRGRANDTLSSGGSVDTGNGRSFGLSAVARLASRHGMRVRLLESPTDGVLAKIHLPMSMLVDTEPARIDTNRPPLVAEQIDLLDLDESGFDAFDPDDGVVFPATTADRYSTALTSTSSTSTRSTNGRSRTSSGFDIADLHAALDAEDRSDYRAQVVSIQHANRRTRV